MSAAFASPLRGGITLFLLVLNTIVWCTPFLPLALLRLLPHAGWRRRCTVILRWLGERWIANTNAVVRRLPVAWEVQVPEGLRRDRIYAIIANHRSWVDILILQQVFARRLPFQVYFVKKELLWLPFIGLAMWALEFPFVERYPREVLTRRPELRGRDLETVRRACEKYREMPVTVVIFPEGTRFTRDKRRRQGAPFRHLLPPRPGGLAVLLGVLGDRLEGLLDVTLIYPPGRSGFWDFLCGRVPRVGARVRPLALPAELRNGDYRRDLNFRARVQAWMDDLWREKDALIASHRREERP